MCCLNRFRFVGHAKDLGLGNNESATIRRPRVASRAGHLAGRNLG